MLTRFRLQNKQAVNCWTPAHSSSLCHKSTKHIERQTNKFRNDSIIINIWMEERERKGTWISSLTRTPVAHAYSPFFETRKKEFFKWIHLKMENLTQKFHIQIETCSTYVARFAIFVRLFSDTKISCEWVDEEEKRDVVWHESVSKVAFFRNSHSVFFV